MDEITPVTLTEVERDALYILAEVIDSKDTLTITLGMVGTQACRRAALRTLATVMPDLTGDAPQPVESDPYAEYRRLTGGATHRVPDPLAERRQLAAAAILAAYTAGMTAAERDEQWDLLCESVIRLGDLYADGPDAADGLPDPMPAGTTSYGIWRGDVDECEDLIEQSLAALTAAPAVVWAAA